VPGCGRGAPPAGAGSQLGPNRSLGGAGGAPGPLRGEGRRPAQGYFLSLIISRVRELQQAFATSIDPVYYGVASIRVRGTTDRLPVRVAKAAGKRCSSGTGSSKGRVVRVSRLV
jgi:hypothetical protein